MKPPIHQETGTPTPVNTGQEQDRLRSSSDASSVLTRNLGPFGGAVAVITLASFLSVELARTDTAAVVIGTIAVAAILAISLRPLYRG